MQESMSSRNCLHMRAGTVAYEYDDRTAHIYCIIVRIQGKR